MPLASWERQAIRRRAWRDAGLCAICGKTPVPGRKACAFHLERGAAKSARQRDAAKTGEPAAWGYFLSETPVRRLKTVADVVVPVRSSWLIGDGLSKERA